MLRFVAFCTLLVASASQGGGDTSVGVHVASSNFEFGFLYSDHYHVAPEVAEHHAEHMGEEDFLVALHLSRASGLPLEAIIRWRRDGQPWDAIRHRCELDDSVFYVDFASDRDPGPPYGRAWGHRRKHSREPLRLSDDEVRAFVVLRTLRDYTKKPAEEILRQRREGWSPKKIAAQAGPVPEDTSPTHKAKHSKAADKNKTKGKSNRK